LKEEVDRAGRRVTADCAQGLAVLYVSEPLRDCGIRQHGNERYFGYTEDDALRFFLSHADLLGAPVRRLVIRTHPSEDKDKYAWVLDGADVPIFFGTEDSLAAEIAQCDVVVGCESMAMVAGLLAGKRVVSCIPPGGRSCPLPHREIEHLARLLDGTSSHGRAAV
jgi:hypothetical protein